MLDAAECMHPLANFDSGFGELRVGRSGARETGRKGEGRGRRELEAGGHRTSASSWRLSNDDLLLGLRLAVGDCYDSVQTSRELRASDLKLLLQQCMGFAM